MKKENFKDKLLYLVLFGCFAGGILFLMVLHYPFFGGMICGSSVTLLIFVTIGRRQLNKAASHLEKKLRDKVLAIQSDNELFTTDD